VHQLVAADFFVVPTATYRLVFVLVLLVVPAKNVVCVDAIELASVGR